MKQGFIMKPLLYLLFFLLVFLAIGFLMKDILFDVGEQQFDAKVCQSSLLFTQAIDTGIDVASSVATGAVPWFCVKVADNPVPLKCSRRYMKVTQDDVLSDGKSIKFRYNPDCSPSSAPDEGLAWGGECLPENVLADEMASCWKTFMEGEVPVFQQIDASVIATFKQRNGRACFVCSEIMVTISRDITNFKENYLQVKQYAFGERKGDTYYDFLAHNPDAIRNERFTKQAPENTCWDAIAQGKDNILARDWPAIDPTIRDGEKYAITFIRHGMGAGACDYVPCLAVHALPAARIAEYCDAVII